VPEGAAAGGSEREEALLMRIGALIGGAAIVVACTASNGQPVVNLSDTGGTNQCRNDAAYGACKRWIRNDGQRVQGSNNAYVAEVNFGAVGGLCATAYVGPSREWYAEPNDDTGCSNPATGWPLRQGFGTGGL